MKDEKGSNQALGQDPNYQPNDLYRYVEIVEVRLDMLLFDNPVKLDEGHCHCSGRPDHDQRLKRVRGDADHCL